MRVEQRMQIEKRIARHAVKAALAAGYAVSVHDGGEWCVKRSRELSTIMDALMSTDSDTLLFRDAQGARIGTVDLVYGNDGYDVIADHSMSLEGLLAPTTAYAESLEMKATG